MKNLQQHSYSSCQAGRKNLFPTAGNHQQKLTCDPLTLPIKTDLFSLWLLNNIGLKEDHLG